MTSLGPSPKPLGPSASLPAATRKRVKACYDRGRELALKKEYDYAHEMFAQCVLLDPGNQTLVETMLQNLRAKFGCDKKKVGHLAGLGGGHGLKKAIGQKNWAEALKLGVHQLESNPWHVPTLCVLADMCAATHHNEVELVYLKQALEVNPRDAEVNRHCARSLARMGQFDQAIACWHRVETILPGNREAARMVSELSEQKLLQATELREQAAKPKTEATPQSEAQAEEETEKAEAKELHLSPRQLLERAIADDPTSVPNYLKLAELLVEDNWLDQAERILEKCLSTCGDDPRVQEKLESVKSQILQERIEEIANRKQPAQPVKIPWLEILLAAAVIGLVLQLAPGLTAVLVDFGVAHARPLIIAGQVVLLSLFILVWALRQRATGR